MKIALVSLDQAWEDKQENFQRCQKAAYEIADSHPDSQLIIFPEMTLTGFSVNNPDIAEPAKTSTSIENFQHLAKQLGIDLIFGISIAEDGAYYNRCIHISAFGQIMASYDKMHTFSYSGESNLYQRGKKPVTTQVADSCIGLSICFDLRFANLYHHYSQDADIIINIANWPSTRVNHWNSLLLARAIENQCFIIGVNRQGHDGNDLSYISSSRIIDPNGDEIEALTEKSDWKVFDINHLQTQQQRQRFPFLKEFRSEI